MDAPRDRVQTFRSVLVVAEIAAAVLVLSGAGLLLRTWISLSVSTPATARPRR